MASSSCPGSLNDHKFNLNSSPNGRALKTAKYFAKTGNGDYYCIACKDGDPSREFIIKEDGSGRKITLQRHLKTEHPVIYRQIVDSQGRLRNFPIAKLEFTGMTEERTLEMWLNQVFHTNLDFEIVQDQSMIDLFSYYTQRDCTLPSVALLEEAALKKYNEVKTSIRKALAPVHKVSITLDLCITKTRVPFVGIRAHWIDDAWTLRERFLSVVDIYCLDDDEADFNLACLVIETLRDFNLMDKVISITTNHAKNNEEMMLSFPEALKEIEASFNKQYLMPCLAHVFNRIVREELWRLGILQPHSTLGFEDSDSPTRPCEFPTEITDNTLQAFIGRLEDAILASLVSPESKALYKKLCKDLCMLDKKGIQLDSINEWISKYEYRVASWAKSRVRDKMAIEAMSMTENNSLAPEKWETLKSRIRMLSPLDYCVGILRKSNSIYASAAIKTLRTLLSMMDSYIKELGKLSFGSSNLAWSKVLLALLKDTYTTMKEKLIVFDNSLKSSPAFAIAVALDPEIKLDGSPIQRGLIYKKMIRLLKKVVKRETSSHHDAPAQQTGLNLFDGTVQEGKNNVDLALEYLQPKAKKPKISVLDELDEYLQEACVVDLDPLSWWQQTGCLRFPQLAVLAKDFLSICPISTSFPRMFEAGLKTVPYETNLDSASVLMTLKCWLWEENSESDMKDELSDG